MGLWDCDAEVLGSVKGVSENDFGTHASTVVREGAFAEMVAFAMALPADERAGLARRVAEHARHPNPPPGASSGWR